MAKGQQTGEKDQGKGCNKNCCCLIILGFIFVITLIVLLGIVYGLVLDYLYLFCYFATGTAGAPECNWNTFVPDVTSVSLSADGASNLARQSCPGLMLLLQTSWKSITVLLAILNEFGVRRIRRNFSFFQHDKMCGMGRGWYLTFVGCITTCNSSYKYASSSNLWSETAVQFTAWVTVLCPIFLVFLGFLWIVLGCIGVGDIWYQNKKAKTNEDRV